MDSVGSHDAPRRVGGSASRILIVDDNADAGNSLAALLRLSGRVVRVEYSASAALAVAERFAPDVILLDLGMPGMDGFKACEAFRRTEVGAHAAIIAVTGWSQAEDRARTLQAGFDAHMAKPVRLPELIAQLDALGERFQETNARGDSPWHSLPAHLPIKRQPPARDPRG